MKRKDISERFEKNQNDLSLPPLQIQWAGNSVRILDKNGETIEMFWAENCVNKIKRFCVQHALRCPQIVNGKITI